MLFPVQTVTDLDSVTTDSESECNNGKYVALMKANFCVDLSFCCILDSGTDSLIQNMF